MNNPTNCAGRAITTGVRDLAVADLRTNPSDKAARHTVPAMAKIGAQDLRTSGLCAARSLWAAGLIPWPSSGCVVWLGVPACLGHALSSRAASLRLRERGKLRSADAAR